MSYLQDILGGGFCPSQQKRVGGILSGGDFVLHSLHGNVILTLGKYGRFHTYEKDHHYFLNKVHVCW